MSLKNISDEDNEALRFENEFLKAKLSAEYGGINSPVNGDVPPEVENEFLTNIIRFEEAMKHAKEILIYDFIGRPEFIKEQDLSDEQLAFELERVNDLMFSKNIVCDILTQVEDRLFYKFLTDELFQQTIMDKRIPGMITHYIYEDFHPDHEYDTRNRCEEFIAIFFSADFHISIRNCSMERIRNFVDLIEFHDAFEEFRNVEFEILDAAAAPTECIRKATISFDAVIEAGTKPIHYSGEATFELEYEYEWWTVISAHFPGMP